MAVIEVVEILADDERVKQLFVDDDEVVNRTVLPRIVDDETPAWSCCCGTGGDGVVVRSR